MTKRRDDGIFLLSHFHQLTTTLCDQLGGAALSAIARRQKHKPCPQSSMHEDGRGAKRAAGYEF